MPKRIAPWAGQRLKINAQSPTKAEIILYAEIGKDWWGDGSYVSAKQFSDELNKIEPTVSEIVLRINSGGGDVFDGIAIYNRLKQHKAKVTVHIDGLAASIASIIALAGDEIFIGEGALYMVHLPWTFAIGNRMELDNTVSRLLDVEEQMISIYSRQTGIDRTEMKALLEAETWMGADEAIDRGFVTAKVEETVPIAASAIGARWIRKQPKNYNSQAKAIDTAKSDLKNKIADRLARK
jgi:ATP-dependent Clp protease protease subunit